jgi:hypothetical protein
MQSSRLWSVSATSYQTRKIALGVKESNAMTKDTSNAVAVRQNEPLTLEQQNAASSEVVKLITRGDLSKLTPDQLVQVYSDQLSWPDEALPQEGSC